MPDPRDSTMEREALEQALTDTEARYRALVERAAYAIYRVDSQGRLTDVNPALLRMLGYASRDDLLAVGDESALFLHPHDAAALRDTCVTTTGCPEWVETRWRKQDGTPVTVRASAHVTGAPGAARQVEVIAEDVTERQRHDELMRRTERMATLGTTLAGVAHELNNPLAAIMGFAQLLLRKEWADDDRSALETINHEAIRSAKIVKDLLTLARAREVERRAPMNLNDIAGYILRTRRYALETYGIACELRLDPTIPPVRGDRMQLEQVVLNLIGNAEHALRTMIDDRDEGHADAAPAHIVIRTRRDGGAVALEVEDNGPGIPAEWQSRIWDPFWTTKEGSEGIGLGLSVVDHIVGEHGGRIHVEDVQPHGARFVILVPALPSSERDADDLRGGSGTAQAERALDVLIVDPEPRNLSFLTRFLTSRGHAVLAANEGGRALHLASQMNFDAVICDAGLRVHDGGALAPALREVRGCAAARFVVSMQESSEPQEASEPQGISEPQDTSDAQEAVPHSPFATVVRKPYDVEQIRRAIEEG